MAGTGPGLVFTRLRGGETIGREGGGMGPSFLPSLPILFYVSPEPEGGRGGATETFLETLSAVPAQLPTPTGFSVFC